ncbi:MAG: hypothetical protein AB7T49_11465 [Oligoflexales bacterium]
MITQETNKREFWEDHIQRWSASGLSRPEYCKQHSLKFNTFHYYQNRLSKPGHGKNFVAASINDGASVQITLANGMVIHCEQGVGLTWLKNLVGTLRH